MKLEFEPYAGLGPVKFLMARQQVRESLSLPYLEMSRSVLSREKSTDFFGKRIFVYYNGNRECIALELAPEPDARRESIRVVWNGIDLLSMNYHALLEYSRSHDSELRVDSEGFDSLENGYGAWCPDYQYDKLTRPRSLIFFIRGYRDGMA